mmetsp:Transcript_9085/g.15040  ORF Transcript_9085/g.15040 Transcript_9085/m.15040 type:complete len:95 (-) Transcript_9085:44-328(-)
MDVHHIGMYSLGTVANFQRSGARIVLAKIRGTSERGADYWSITYERSGTVVTHDCALVARMSPAKPAAQVATKSASGEPIPVAPVEHVQLFRVK